MISKTRREMRDIVYNKIQISVWNNLRYKTWYLIEKNINYPLRIKIMQFTDEVVEQSIKNIFAESIRQYQKQTYDK